MATKKQTTNKKLKLKIKLPSVRLFLKAGFNNSIVTLTDLNGRVITWSSGGKAGFKGSKKSTPFAAQKATEEILEKVKMIEASSVHIELNGPGLARDSFLRAIQNTDLQIESITDTTGFPHGGITKKKKRRV